MIATVPVQQQLYLFAVDAGSTQVDLVAHAFSTEIGPAIRWRTGG